MFDVLMSEAHINLNSFQDGSKMAVLVNRSVFCQTDPLFQPISADLPLLFILRIWRDPHQIVNAKDGDGSLWKLGTWVTPGGTHMGW